MGLEQAGINFMLESSVILIVWTALLWGTPLDTLNDACPLVIVMTTIEMTK